MKKKRSGLTFTVRQIQRDSTKVNGSHLVLPHHWENEKHSLKKTPASHFCSTVCFCSNFCVQLSFLICRDIKHNTGYQEMEKTLWSWGLCYHVSLSPTFPVTRQNGNFFCFQGVLPKETLDLVLPRSRTWLLDFKQVSPLMHVRDK